MWIGAEQYRKLHPQVRRHISKRKPIVSCCWYYEVCIFQLNEECKKKKKRSTVWIIYEFMIFRATTLPIRRRIHLPNVLSPRCALGLPPLPARPRLLPPRRFEAVGHTMSCICHRISNGLSKSAKELCPWVSCCFGKLEITVADFIVDKKKLLLEFIENGRNILVL